MTLEFYSEKKNLHKANHNICPNTYSVHWQNQKNPNLYPYIYTHMGI